MNPFNLPELRNQVGRFLESGSLLQACLVCRAWYEDLFPLFCMKLENSRNLPTVHTETFPCGITITEQTSRHYRLLEVSEEWMSMYGHLIKYADCHDLRTLHQLLRYNRGQMIQFSFRFSTRGQIHTPMCGTAYIRRAREVATFPVELLEASPKIRDLNLVHLDLEKDKLVKVLAGLPLLERLSTRLADFGLDILATQCPRLKFLSLGMINQDDRFFTLTQDLSVLEVLHLTSGVIDLSSMTRHMPNLQELQTYMMWPQVIPPTAGLRFLYLTSLDLGPNATDADGINIARVIGLATRLVNFKTSLFENSIRDALLHHAVSLEKVECYEKRSGKDETKSISPLPLLESCFRLRVLDMPAENIDFNDVSTTELWPCTDLQVLRVKFCGVSRQNDAIVGEISVAARQKSLRIQNNVMDQLACMTNLRHLDIGLENREQDDWKFVDKKEPGYGPHTNCLELSIESGFAKLASLVRLEKFGVERLNHVIGVPEVDILVELPNLFEIRGLFEFYKYPNGGTVEHSQDPLPLHVARLRELRPEILLRSTCYPTLASYFE